MSTEVKAIPDVTAAGKFLKQARKKRGLSMLSAAEAAGLSLGTVRNIERGRYGTITTIYAYADALGVGLAAYMVDG